MVRHVVLLLMLTSAATDTMLFADPKDVTVEANQWAQFNCTVHCTHTRTVGWYMAGYDHAIKRNNTIPGLLIKRTSDSKCTSNQKIHYFEVYATEAWNKSTFYCAAYERHQKSCSCGKGGRCYSRPALLTGEPVFNVALDFLSGSVSMSFSKVLCTFYLVYARSNVIVICAFVQ